MRGLVCLALVVCILGLCSSVAAAETPLTDEQLRELLFELAQQQTDGGEFLVVPEDFRMPEVGADGEFRLLILGVDMDRAGFRRRSDTMILAVFNAHEESLHLISFMRDLYVKIPGRGHNRLNAAYAYGGSSLLQDTLRENFGIEADAYVAVDFSAMITLVDNMGGISMRVEDFELKPLNGILSYYNQQNGQPKDIERLEKAGEQLLTGLQAMSYARIRKPDSDFERVERQQAVVRAIYQKALSLPLDTLMELVINSNQYVGTDLTTTQATGLLQDVLGAKGLSIQTMSVPVPKAFSSKLINQAYYLVPNLQKNRAAISAFLLPDH